MIICGIIEEEVIRVHPEEDLDEAHYIKLTVDKDEPMFYVTCCCNDEWLWAFDYSKSSYEMVKHVIIDVLLDNETIVDAMDMLDEIFYEEFDEIVAYCYEDEDEF